MQWQERFRRARAEWMLLTFYERFEQVVILILTGLIAIVVVFAVWNLGLKIFHAVLSPQNFDPTDYSVFQAIFGAIFTVIIALEFKRSLLIVAQRQESIVQVRTVILIALLAIVRKLIILDLAVSEERYADEGGERVGELFGQNSVILRKRGSSSSSPEDRGNRGASDERMPWVSLGRTADQHGRHIPPIES